MDENLQPRVMVVEDDETREVLSKFLSGRGYRAHALDPAAAIRRLQTDRPDAVILNLAGEGGIDLLPLLRNIDREIPLLLICDRELVPGREDVSHESSATLIGRPFEGRDLDAALTRAIRQRPGLDAGASEGDGLEGVLLGYSPSMVEVRTFIRQVADTDVTVLVCGESGTGKELVARALHDASRRRDKPFVKVNCAALPNDLLESELFGFERGAFTGAMQAKPGKFEFAHHGTMFLDEIGDMSPQLQAKLLQVLQDGEFSRLGGTSDVRVNARIIAATNRHLDRAVADGQFREDLYFRLNVVNVTLPPLRERKEDIPLLVEHLLRQHAAAFRNRRCGTLSDETERLFMQHDWPGNVRELENLIKRFIVLGNEVSIRRDIVESRAARTTESEPRTLALVAQEPASVPPSLKEIGRTAAREAERAAILDMLERTRWNRKEAAESLGISYKALLYKIKENRLDEAS